MYYLIQWIYYHLVLNFFGVSVVIYSNAEITLSFAYDLHFCLSDINLEAIVTAGFIYSVYKGLKFFSSFCNVIYFQRKDCLTWKE